MKRGTTKQRIIDVALDLFADEGFGGTSVTDIERGAGLSPGSGSFYRHFPSKEEVLRCAIDQEIETLLEASRQVRAEMPEAVVSAAERAEHYGQMLADTRRWDRLVRIFINVSNNFPEARRMVSKALGRAGTYAWPDPKRDLVAVAAIGGFTLLQQLPGGPFQDMTDDEFVQLLADFGTEP